MRKGGWMISRSGAMPNSGTTRPLAGNSASRSTRETTSRSRRSPTSGTSSSAYHARMSSRSATADSAKLILCLAGTSDQTEAALDVGEIRLATLVQVHQALDDAAQERPLLGLGLVFRQRLDDRDAAPPAGEQNGPTGLIHLMHDATWVDFEVAQRNDIL